MVATLVIAMWAILPVQAEQFWVAYEGNDFPEKEGWSRTFSQGGATRSLWNGFFVLDSRHDVGIVDYYSIERLLNPGPDETFVMQWGLATSDISAREDATVVVFSDDGFATGFEFGHDYLVNAFNPSVRVSYAPNIAHNFVLETPDMRSFRLSMDGAIVLDGVFVSVFSSSRVSWGDGVQGSASLSQWDYFRFGVVPEPSVVWLFFIGLIVIKLECSRR